MTERKKVTFVLIDGVGDVSHKKLENQTPLQFAKTPNIDKLAEKGVCGVMDPYCISHSCGSDTAHMSIFGYNPEKFYTGRGCFECMGAGLHLDFGDIGFKSNFATFAMNEKNQKIVVKRRCDRSFEKEGPILCDYLGKELEIPGFPDYKFAIKYATEHRCGIRIKGKKLSNKISGTDPLRDNLELIKCVPTVEKEDKDYKDAKRTSDIINATSNRITELLSKHEINKQREKEGKNIANCILFRGCGTRIEVPNFEANHKMKGFLIAPTCIIAGFGLSIDLDLIYVEGATGDQHTDLNAKRKAHWENIKKDKYDFGFLHIKGIDDLSHENMVEEKVEMIEKVDKMIGDLVKDMEKDDARHIIVITGDHTTPCTYKDHSFEPVPFLIADANKKPKYSDKVKKFSEPEVYCGSLGRFPGSQVFPIIKNF